MEQGREAMVEQDFTLALEFFEEAEKINPESSEVQQYIQIVNKMLLIENLDTVEEADQFIEKSRADREAQLNQEEIVVSDELQDDFIYQQEQKDKARQQRTPLFFQFSIPFAVPEYEDMLIDENLLFSNGYLLEFAVYPGKMKSIVGFGFEVDNGILSYQNLGGDRSNILGNVYFRNFIAEEVGARLIFGSKVGAGFTMINGIGLDYQVIPSWHLSLFFSDPVFYHLLGEDSFKPMILSGNIAILYGDNLNIIDGNAALTYKFHRFDIGLNYYYAYVFDYQEISIQPWSLALIFGLNL